MKSTILFSVAMLASTFASQAIAQGVPVGAIANPEAAMTALFGDPAVVKAKGFEIKRSDLDLVLSAARANEATAKQTVPSDLEISVLDQLITIQVLLQTATSADQAAGKIDSDQEFTKLLTQFSSPEAFRRLLMARGLTVEDLRAKALQEAVAKVALKRGLNIHPTDEEALDYYRLHSADFEKPEMVRVQHILLMTIDPSTRKPLMSKEIAAKRQQIEELRKRILTGEDFSGLAKRYSEDPGSKDSGGELPKFARGQMVPEFESAAFSLPANQLSDVITTQFGYHLIKVLERIPAKKSEFAKVNPEIKELLTQQKIHVLSPDYIKKLRADQRVEIQVADLRSRDGQIQAKQAAVAYTASAASTAYQSEAARFHDSGNAKLAKSDWAGAIADYTKAIELQPEDAESFVGRGQAKQGKGDWDGAITDYCEAIELKPGDADVRRKFAEGLGQRGDAGVVVPLLRLTGSENEAVRTNAEAALVKLGSASVAGFVPVLNDTNSNYRLKAVELLGRTGNKQAVAPLLAVLPDVSLRQGAATALAALGEPLGERWLRLLAGEDAVLAEDGAAKDSRMVPLLIIGLRDENSNVGGNAARALGKLGDAQAVEPLIRVLGDGSDGVRRNAAEALVKLGALSVSPLVQALERGDAGVRTNAEGVLISLGSRSVPALVSVLKSSQLASRLQAIELLGRIGDKHAVEPLMALLPVAALRQAAAGALDKLGEPMGGRWVRMLQGDPAALNELTASNDVRVAALLLQTLGDQDAAVRATVATALGRLKVNEGVEPVVGRLADASPLVRQRAAEALGNMGDAGAVPPLIRSLGDADPDVRQNVAKALWQLPRPAGAEMLAASLAGSGAWSARLRAGSYLVSEPTPMAGDYLKACQKVLLSEPSLFYSGILALVFALAGWFWVHNRRTTVPGIGGWLALGCLWVVLILYGLMLRWSWGTAVFLAVALSPAWLSLPVGVGLGVLRWPKERHRAAGFVCRNDFHRYVPGPNLGWLTRWSGRWLWREQGAPKRLAESCVCRSCGGRASHYEGVQEVVAVLDNQIGSYPQQQDGVLRVNWLAKKQPFDFDRVEVVAAGDDEVDEFVRQTRFDSDEQMQKRLPKMLCVVNAQCRFQREENTMTILRQTFGSITKD